ncbi:HD domain-containing protein [Halobacillus halophilus]|uniref:HD domain-containing protein n=1 Tax=Halobacillus halophilus TaxID=1570 RepID=UPI001CD7A011|nr:HD domain-containing protein [Halobacillus halophilus]MCA1012492.1 HD domain-containing protein [Halobacillus halophilus]
MIEKASRFAAEAHRGQKRKNSNTDYFVHPERVADSLLKAGFRQEIVCAGYLHDVVEDTSYTLQDIEKEFGLDVKALVEAHTEDKSKSWQERKSHTIQSVREGSLELKALIVADKLDNLQSLITDLEVNGDKVWSNFNADYRHQKWYYQSVAEVMEVGLKEKDVPAFFNTYRKLVKQTFD